MISLSDLRSPWPEWSLREQLGEGTFSTVWRAIRESPPAESAIKALHVVPDGEETSSRSESQIRRKADERLAATVGELDRLLALRDAAHVVRVDDYRVVSSLESHETVIWIRMELLKSLTAYSADKDLTEQEIILLGLDLCDALAAFHSRDTLHCDVKPDNILVDDSRSAPVFKLGDLGISRRLLETSAFLAPCGSPAYMAPELSEGKLPDPRSDLYSLGLTLYRLANDNRLPFWPDHPLVSSSDRAMALHMRLSGMPLPAPAKASPAFSALLLRACAFEPSQRFQDAEDFRTALQGLLNRNLRKERSAGLLRSLRKPSFIISIAAILLLLAALLFWKPALRSVPSSPSPVPMVSAVRLSLYDSLKEQLEALHTVLTSSDHYIVPVHLDRLPLFADLRNLPLSPAWKDDALVLNDSSADWNVFLTMPDGKVISFIPSDTGADGTSGSGTVYRPVSPVGSDAPSSLSVVLGSSAASRFVLELNYNPVDLTSASTSLILYSANRAVLSELSTEPASPDLWHLRQTPEAVPLTALYGADLRLRQITYHRQTWDAGDSLPILEGVEYLP